MRPNSIPITFAESNIGRFLFLGRCFRALSHEIGAKQILLVIRLIHLLCRILYTFCVGYYTPFVSDDCETTCCHFFFLSKDSMSTKNQIYYLSIMFPQFKGQFHFSKLQFEPLCFSKSTCLHFSPQSQIISLMAVLEINFWTWSSTGPVGLKFTGPSAKLLVTLIISIFLKKHMPFVFAK